jgi:predicted transcriptional regulator
LTDAQRQGIFDAMAEIDEGKGIAHEKVMTKVRKKYLNA